MYDIRIHINKFPPSIHGIYSIGLPISIEEIAIGMRVTISSSRIVIVTFIELENDFRLFSIKWYVNYYNLL